MEIRNVRKIKIRDINESGMNVGKRKKWRVKVRNLESRTKGRVRME